MQSFGGSNSSTSSRAETLGATPTTGNKLILVSCVEGSEAISSITQTNVSWAKLAGTTAGSAPVVEIWVGTVSASAGTGVTIAYAASSYGCVAIIEMTSLAGMLDQSGTRSDNFVPAITPTDTGALVVFGVSQDTFASAYGTFGGAYLLQFPGATNGSYFGFAGTNTLFGLASRTDPHTGTIHGIAVSLT